MIALTLTGLWVLCSFITFLLTITIVINDDPWVDFGNPAEGWPAFAWSAGLIALGPISLLLAAYGMVADWVALKFE